MALSASNLTFKSDTTNAVSYDTSSIQPSSSSLVLVSIHNRISAGTAGTPTLTGNGLTYVLVNQTTGLNRASHLFRALGVSPTSSLVTISFSTQTQTEVTWVIDQITGTDTSGSNGSGAVVQSANGSTTDTSLTLFLNNFGSSNNFGYGCVEHGANNDTTPNAGFNELADVGNSEVGTRLATIYLVNNTGVGASWSGSLFSQCIACEIKEEVSSSGFNLKPTMFQVF